MNTKYSDLIDQTYYFPQEEFTLEGSELRFHDIDLMELVKKYGAPLKFTYLPKISDNINRAKGWFKSAIEKHNYKGSYNYCYCTKSSHFEHVLNEALKNDIHIETSSAFDINIVEKLKQNGKLSNDNWVICNGFKRDQYIENISRLLNGGHKKCIPVIDNYEELDLLTEKIDSKFQVGIRIASEEEPKFEFYTSRLGIGYKDIVPFYKKQIMENEQVDLRMLHFFINTGIRDTAYYWNELNKCLKVYINLKRICPSLDSLNIGGGFPIKNSLAFDYDYAYMVEEIVNQIQLACEEAEVDVPNIFTEFGSFTVGESGGAIYEILYQKQQNDREKWNMINSSFITTLPDTWAISKNSSCWRSIAGMMNMSAYYWVALPVTATIITTLSSTPTPSICRSSNGRNRSTLAFSIPAPTRKRLAVTVVCNTALSLLQSIFSSIRTRMGTSALKFLPNSKKQVKCWKFWDTTNAVKFLYI